MKGTATALQQEASPRVEAVKEQAAAMTEPARTAVTETLDQTKDATAVVATALSHPTEPAVAIAITKEVGHTLCKGCHQTRGGNVPTACGGCHVR